MLIDKNTAVLGLIGYPLAHSLSPKMQNFAMQKMNFNGIYLPLEIKLHKLESALNTIKVLNLRGFNVTVPYKEKVIPYLDELSPEARECGAVNAIVNREGKMVGYNMDGKGFLGSLAEAELHPEGSVIILGAGGAAKAIAYSLSRTAVNHIYLLARNLNQAQQLAEFINQKGKCRASSHLLTYDIWNELCKKANLIINCTPVGMYPQIDESPVSSMDNVPSDTVICDIVYNPLQTKFLKMARNKKLRTLNGLTMLVYQGALSLELWTGQKPPLKDMLTFLKNHFSTE